VLILQKYSELRVLNLLGMLHVKQVFLGTNLYFWLAFKLCGLFVKVLKELYCFEYFNDRCTLFLQCFLLEWVVIGESIVPALFRDFIRELCFINKIICLNEASLYHSLQVGSLDGLL
jgi:hypothetical protein